MASKTDKASMTKAMKKAEALLREMVALTLRPDLTRNQRTNLETCVTVHMHQKETTGGLRSPLISQRPGFLASLDLVSPS